MEVLVGIILFIIAVITAYSFLKAEECFFCGSRDIVHREGLKGICQKCINKGKII